MNKVEVAPSILAADFARLAEEVAAVERSAGRIHVDVMDGHFVPNLSMGPAVVKSLARVTSLPLEVHLMVENPQAFIEPFIEAGAARIIFHVESSGDSTVTAEQIASLGAAAGVCVRPGTDVREALEHVELVDLILVMTVEPGFGGQEFLEGSLPSVTTAYEAVTEWGSAVDIEVDGGVDVLTGARARRAGANVFVAGTSIFGAEDPALAASELLESLTGEVGV